MKKTLILFSGGLDSTLLVALAHREGRAIDLLSFDYEQRHIRELEAAAALAAFYQLPHHIVAISSHPLGGSSLIARNPSPPKGRSHAQMLAAGIPSSYVPARNTLFLAHALAMAEILESEEIWIGFNRADHDLYPDCRTEYLEAMQQVANLATKRALLQTPPLLRAPLISMDKTEIFTLGRALGAPIEMSFSCYDPLPNGTPCRNCDACIIRTEASHGTL